MDKKHISQEDWLLYFSSDSDNSVKNELHAQILTHIASCAQCKEFYEKAMDLQNAASAYAAALHSQEKPDTSKKVIAFPGSKKESNAFRAVAAAPATSKQKKLIEGNISICIDSQINEAVLLENTLSQEGYARKYALNVEEDDTLLIDDEEMLKVELNGRIATIYFDDESLTCTCHLIPEIEDEITRQVDDTSHSVSIELPEDNFCTLELIITE